MAAKSAGVESGDWIASRMSFTVTVLPPANGVLRGDAEGYVGAVGSAVMLFGSALWRGRLPVTQASGRANR
jgi:citrate lyase alpha subunit